MGVHAKVLTHFVFWIHQHFLVCTRENLLEKYLYVACDNIMHFTHVNCHACIREYSLLCEALTRMSNCSNTCVFSKIMFDWVIHSFILTDYFTIIKGEI